MHRFLLLFWVYLSVLQRPQVQQVNITWQWCTERLERAELGQLAASRGHHGEWRVAQGEWGQVSEQREMFNGGPTHFLLCKHTKRAHRQCGRLSKVAHVCLHSKILLSWHAFDVRIKTLQLMIMNMNFFSICLKIKHKRTKNQNVFTFWNATAALRGAGDSLWHVGYL